MAEQAKSLGKYEPLRKAGGEYGLYGAISEHPSQLKYDSDPGGYGRDAHETDDELDAEFPRPNRPMLTKSTRPTTRVRKKYAVRSKQVFKHQPRKRRVAFCCICDELRIRDLFRALLEQKRRGKQQMDALQQPWKVSMLGEVLYRYTDGMLQTHDGEEPQFDPWAVKDVFVFPYGCIVFWGCRLEEEREFLDFLKQYGVRPVSQAEFEESLDDMAFVYVPNDSSEGEVQRDSMKIHLMASKSDYEATEGRTGALLQNDVLTLQTLPTWEEKLAMSFAMAQSAKLSVFEERCSNKIDEYRYIPEALTKHGYIPLRHHKLARMVGDLFVQRNEINLHSDILDTPDYFWEDDTYEPEYNKVWKYLDVDRRVELLNQRLNVMKELLEVLQVQLDTKHASKLDNIIIWLIVCEGVMEVLVILLRRLGWYDA